MNRKVGTFPGLVEKENREWKGKTLVRLRRSLKLVSVVDLDGVKLYEIDRQTANDHLRNSRALVVDSCSIRMSGSVAKPGKYGSVMRAGSLECLPIFRDGLFDWRGPRFMHTRSAVSEPAE
jgi:hypothetical protein